MSQPTVRERLNQIVEYGIPHTTRTGNYLGNEVSQGSAHNTPVGTLEGNIMEYVVTKKNLPSEFVSGNEYISAPFVGAFYAEKLSAASGSLISAKDFQKGQFVDSTKIECHAFYDPLTDITHFFILPSRDAVQEAESYLRVR